ncbi:hypothetical protein [Persicobacter diffluens]|uniref:Uncharacterized protein n=1 Tax=Persicobacter diffluens TaxID=981 RepID=A0AAN4W3M0_9BACT|nr:hypothetical protein PEDI_39170 [Persicobacter diffluens]
MKIPTPLTPSIPPHKQPTTFPPNNQNPINPKNQGKKTPSKGIKHHLPYDFQTFLHPTQMKTPTPLTPSIHPPHKQPTTFPPNNQANPLNPKNQGKKNTLKGHIFRSSHETFHKLISTNEAFIFWPSSPLMHRGWITGGKISLTPASAFADESITELERV